MILDAGRSPHPGASGESSALELYPYAEALAGPARLQLKLGRTATLAQNPPVFWHRTGPMNMWTIRRYVALRGAPPGGTAMILSATADR